MRLSSITHIMGSHKVCVLLMFTLITVGESSNKETSSRACHPNDLKGLRHFKEAISSDTSGRLATWNGQSCCKWGGISCDNKTGRVNEINLPGMISDSDAPEQAYMYGKLSPSITLITSLQVIDLSGLYFLTGVIPPAIGFHLPKLRKLYLSLNKLTGALPDSIGKLSHLEELYLFENRFSKPLPFSLGSLTNLRYLDLHHNKFSGKIPESISNLTKLEYLNIEQNSVTGHIPAGIGNLQVLTDLSLSN